MFTLTHSITTHVKTKLRQLKLVNTKQTNTHTRANTHIHIYTCLQWLHIHGRHMGPKIFRPP